MNSDRRNLLMGLGALTVGGGAVMGSGAFTEAAASVTREVEVTVMAQGNLAPDYTDILVLASDFSSVDVGPAGGTSVDDGSTYFPTTDNYYDFSGGPSAQYQSDPKDVSRFADPIRIVFGDSTSLPPNSTVSYNNLFAAVNETGGSNNASFIVDMYGKKNVIDWVEGPKQVDAGESHYFDADINTDSDGTQSGQLVIEITPV